MLILAGVVIAHTARSFIRTEDFRRINVVTISQGTKAIGNICRKIWVITISGEISQRTDIWHEVVLQFLRSAIPLVLMSA